MSQAFPESLFHQLLMAMVHPDHETRVGAHRIFSVVLVPSSVCPHARASNSERPMAYDVKRTLSRTVSVFSSSAALFDKIRSGKPNVFKELKNNDGPLNKLQSSQSRFYSVKYTAFPIGNESVIGNPGKGKVSFRDYYLFKFTLYIYLYIKMMI